MSNLSILTPEIPGNARRFRSRQTFADNTPLVNVIARDRRHFAALASTYGWGLFYEFDLGKDLAGNASTKTADFLYLARADFLQGAGFITQVRLQGSTVSSLTPSDISGLYAWYDANLEWDTTPVGSWNDLSGNARTLTQGTALNKPALTSAIYNGFNGIDFDGSNDHLLNNTGSLSQPSTVFVVVRPDVVTGTKSIVDSNSGAISAIRIFNSNYELHSGSQLFGGAATAGATEIVIGEFNGASSKIFINNGTTAANTGNAGTNARAGIRVGLDFTGGAPFDGKVFEVIIYNKILSSTERQQVYDYLNAKWKTTPQYSDTSFNSVSLVGPNLQDFVTDFTQSSAFRYWWLFFRVSAASYYAQSKVWCGNKFDLGREVEEYGLAIPIDDRARWESSSGGLRRIRNQRPRYRYEITWKGVTDSKVAEFADKVASERAKSSLVLYATSQATVLQNKTAIHCRLLESESEKLFSGSSLNRITATFEELPS